VISLALVTIESHTHCFSFCITIANELAAANTILNFWTDEVPIAAWIVIWWVVLTAINVGAVTVFGEIEVISSTIKFG
jgi:yeast amino acid transporter